MPLSTVGYAAFKISKRKHVRVVLEIAEGGPARPTTGPTHDVYPMVAWVTVETVSVYGNNREVTAFGSRTEGEAYFRHVRELLGGGAPGDWSKSTPSDWPGNALAPRGWEWEPLTPRTVAGMGQAERDLPMGHVLEAPGLAPTWRHAARYLLLVLFVLCCCGGIYVIASGQGLASGVYGCLLIVLGFFFASLY